MIISPAFDLVPTGAQIPPFDVAVFTSRAGVAFAPAGMDRPAFCVGDATAAAAAAAGYLSNSASGAVDDLVEMILQRRPAGNILHLRGENSIGNVIGSLAGADLKASSVVVYRKKKEQAAPELGQAREASAPMIFPAFSAETVSIIKDWRLDLTRSHVVAISDAVAQAALGLDAASIRVSSRPDETAMLEACAGIIA